MKQPTITPRYHQGLGRQELIDELRVLLVEARDVERLICRYLADLADALAHEENVLGAPDVHLFAEKELGLRPRQTCERIRIGRALRDLPALEDAFLSGQISYSRTREVTRVAKPETELHWLAMARELPMRALERLVAQGAVPQGAVPQGAVPQGAVPQGAGPQVIGDPADDRVPIADGDRDPNPAPPRYGEGDLVELRMTLPAETAALLERAMRAAERAAGRAMTDVEALEAIACEALAAQGADDDDVADDTDGVAQRGNPPSAPVPPSLPPRQAKVLAAMGGRRGWCINALCRETGLPAQEVNVALLLLLLGGQVVKEDGERYTACFPVAASQVSPPRPRFATQGGSLRDGVPQRRDHAGVATQGGSRRQGVPRHRDRAAVATQGGSRRSGLLRRRRHRATQGGTRRGGLLRRRRHLRAPAPRNTNRAPHRLMRVTSSIVPSLTERP